LAPVAALSASKSFAFNSLISAFRTILSQVAHATLNLHEFLLGLGYSESGTTSSNEPEKMLLIKSWSAIVSGLI